jgi:hypothetical protein
MPPEKPLSAAESRKYNTVAVAAYWSDGWELRHLDYLRYHGFWGPESERMGA